MAATAGRLRFAVIFLGCQAISEREKAATLIKSVASPNQATPIIALAYANQSPNEKSDRFKLKKKLSQNQIQIQFQLQPLPPRSHSQSETQLASQILQVQKVHSRSSSHKTPFSSSTSSIDPPISPPLPPTLSKIKSNSNLNLSTISSLSSNSLSSSSSSSSGPFDDFLVKPFSKLEVEDKVKNWCNI